ncbi:alkaline phosphatase [Pseudarthrobacter sp. NPDC092184]|uniref:alkaline phosphatase n=1 Tax=Pseudarthrobacter TaxID=1742993 RepID=UPI00168B0358|nr:alkaline phosphatase [Pseudarthrobacter sp. BIM B-2242]QOD02000.1 alkaline phosphatase [Pseudarthrobacter sp. BIM B-2242]BFE45654.1 alkaline phosphatase [Pseudarthrobacter oxydans]
MTQVPADVTPADPARKRRRIIWVVLAAVVATVVATGLISSAVFTATKPAPGTAQNVIYLLGDGMGRTQVTAGRERFYGAEGRLVMETLPAHGSVSTYAVQKNSGQPGQSDFAPELVTDSAAAATAWASGVKTYNAALGVDATGHVVPTMMELAKQTGYRTGSVSTAEITDASPAGQMSHVLSRGCQGPDYSADACQDTEITGEPLPTSDVRVTPIADQIARNGTADIIFGGGLRRFDASDETELKEQGYSILGSVSSQIPATRDDLNGAVGEKVFGLFNKGNLTVEKAKQDDPGAPQAKEPSLPEMTKKALELLNQQQESSGKGFYLQVEGSLIDKRSHDNDAAQTLEEVKAFDDAVAAALDFAKKDGNTLVIVTADHETGGFHIIEKGSFTNAEAAAPPVNVDSGNAANNSTPTRSDGNFKDPERSTGISNGAGAKDQQNFGPATFRTPSDPPQVKDGSKEASLWLSYASGNHSGADVPVYAYGPGSEQLQGSVDNTDLFDIVGNALGVLG